MKTNNLQIIESFFFISVKNRVQQLLNTFTLAQIWFDDVRLLL